MKLAVTVATYQRPDQLRRLLHSLAEGGLEVADAEVIVVDNAPSPGQAEAVVDALQGGPPVRSVWEPTPGIAAARNRAVAEAAGADLVAFVDDDEIVDPGWAAALLATQAATGADLVTGPVLPLFRDDVPAWATRGGYFERATHEEGDRLDAAATNNLLVTRRALDALSPCFDPAFGLTGGSDHLFTRRAVTAGFEISWSEAAIVREEVGGDRANRAWLLRRSFRFGTTTVRCDAALAGASGRQVRARRGAQHAGLAARATGRATASAVRGQRDEAFWALRDVVRGLGGVWGAAGGRYEEYRRR